MKVAIIGAGPRGLWAAEELFSRARERGAAIELSVYNDGPVATAGGLGSYQPDLPAEWVLNVPAETVHTRLGGLNEWRGDDDEYPSRRVVGRFIAASWSALAHWVPAGCTVQIVDHRVDEIIPADGGVAVDGTRYDEALLATGHAEDWPGALAPDSVEGVNTVVRAFPPGNLDAIGAHDTALVRGAALTFVDVVRYCRAGIFYPVARGGRFMDVKCHLAPDQAAQLRPALRAAEDSIRGAAGFTELIDALADLSLDVLAAAGGAGDKAGVRAVLAGRDGTDPVEDLRASYEVAVGSRAWTPAAAVGYAFRAAYGAVVERASFGGRDSLGGERFGELTTTLERVAFGPPAETAGQVLGMIESGRIRTDLLGRGDEDLTALAREVGATAVVDAVNAPPGPVKGTVAGLLVERGIARVHGETGAIMVERDGTLVGQQHLAAAGRMSEGWILGHDTLRRGEHEVIPAWARRVSRAALADPERVHGMPPLRACLEPWAQRLLADNEACRGLIRDFSSPVNVVDAEPLKRNAAELVEAAAAEGVELRLYYARKANKALAFVDAVRDAGHGVDVASENELRQVLERGVRGRDIILTAAVKPDALLRLAIDSGVVISVDNAGEYERIADLAAGRTVRVAPRLAPDPAAVAPTRFGERKDTWLRCCSSARAGVRVVGVHVHLNGYAAADRRVALEEAVRLVDGLRDAGHELEFIDLGGGVPMSYLAHEEQWRAYEQAIAAQPHGYAEPFTWKADPLTTVYPYWQSPTRGAWLREVLGGGTAAALRERGLRLHLEPGRALLDGCGLTLAEVAFVKERSDGVPLVGLYMNRTQCRSTSDDYLVDPILIRASEPGEELEAFLVGAYCIEDELILRRKVRFPSGVAPGDIVAIPNTAGYLMHILESASHQIPLARNVVWPAGELDAIDAAG
ncbi:FAD/NAD(P)-binding protein [Corynebacterium timonense]|uniref:Diaminopimelate decarboxylase n=1 Tax=Corynebacterium timonense TaxID=441500 RepID=A0A1H1PT28_9CORY|nr:FAD/NAD(P)-binding protein [Corynebacterium timonense]SDS13879.1 diaminopimelate decarboxylase [Corynebacterium timonense]